MGCYFIPGRWSPSSPKLLLLLLIIVGNSVAQTSSIVETTIGTTSIAGDITANNDDEGIAQQRKKIYNESHYDVVVEEEGEEMKHVKGEENDEKKKESIRIPADASEKEIAKFIKKRFKYLLGDKKKDKKIWKDKSQLPVPLKSPVEYGHFYKQCMVYDNVEEDGYEGWQHSERIKSSHQFMDFYHHPASQDKCLVLDGYLHVCLSQRSHYHEMFVHYPAKYLKKVERVLFLGGGDSMVLNEVLKYNDLELVVGLELDQKVTRQSFKHFGTQPHFDLHNKVQWWFGDAAASMNAIPTEYYGSFDLVVVDLVTVVHQNLMVAPNMSLMDAAMMMMKPDTGIIIKNDDEFYVPGTTDPHNFPYYRADVLAYDFPLYCIQTFVLGSNTIDFAKANLNMDHPMSDDGNLYLQDGDFRSQFDTWYTSATPDSLGERTTTIVVEEENKEGIIQENEEEDDSANIPTTTSFSAGSTTIGLAMIIEAEQIKIPTLESSMDVQEILNKKTENLSFRRIKSLPPQELANGGYTLISLLEEGCITARCFPSKQYCAIDVQLWKKLDQAEFLKMELLSALQSEESSVYRIITTGVVKEEENNDKIGPPSSHSNKKMKTATKKNSVTDDKTNSSQSSSDEIQKTLFKGRKETKLEYMNTTPDDYDSTSALEQWESQEPLATQRIVKYKLPVDNKYNKKSLAKLLKRLLTKAMTKASGKWENKDKDQIFVEHYDVGNALVIVATWSEGTIVLLWDGVSRFNMNCFSLEGTSTMKAIRKSVEKYLEHAEAEGDKVLQDMFPRGMGRVINFRKEFEITTDDEGGAEEGEGQRRRRSRPYWAPPLSQDSSKE